VNLAPSVVACLLLAGLAAGCDPVTAVLGGGAIVGMSAAEERGVEGAVDDTRIRASINQLWFDADTEIYRKVTLTVNEGRVMLTGSVPRPEQRIETVRLTWQAPGVREVLDEIQVEDQSGLADYSRDTWIANTLRTRLMFAKNVRNVNYTVDVVNGVVYLMGIAQNAEELDRVVAYARDIAGVKRVVSHVMLKDDPRRLS
jgi:osmotically-inducible protein OsmY